MPLRDHHGRSSWSAPCRANGNRLFYLSFRQGSLTGRQGLSLRPAIDPLERWLRRILSWRGFFLGLSDFLATLALTLGHVLILCIHAIGRFVFVKEVQSLPMLSSTGDPPIGFSLKSASNGRDETRWRSLWRRTRSPRASRSAAATASLPHAAAALVAMTRMFSSVVPLARSI